MPIITLTTDFGTRDGYVGAVKGVIARVAGPQHWAYTTIVDVAHDIPRGDIAHAAWVVATSTPEYPAGSIHMVVVDPGVGGSRPAVIVESAGQIYVGPDNGVFGYLDSPSAHLIAKTALLAPKVSSTFHGRDIFAYVAARLVSGYSPPDFGKATRLVGRLPWGTRPPGVGRIVHVDVFGNLITDLPPIEAGGHVLVGTRRVSVVRTYDEVMPGELLAYVGSAGTIEIAIRDGRADTTLGLTRGDKIFPDSNGTGPYR
ncbi:MAG: SAM-dependent chlorinase/fluorinase [Kofleriaceae bacterium]|nr:SAM-dependent chlorinase/fluorinase [Kofleriaceae bacterium]